MNQDYTDEPDAVKGITNDALKILNSVSAEQNAVASKKSSLKDTHELPAPFYDVLHFANYE